MATVHGHAGFFGGTTYYTLDMCVNGRFRIPVQEVLHAFETQNDHLSRLYIALEHIAGPLVKGERDATMSERTICLAFLPAFRELDAEMQDWEFGRSGAGELAVSDQKRSRHLRRERTRLEKRYAPYRDWLSQQNPTVSSS